MVIFVYEHLTGGGLLDAGKKSDLAPLAAEGRAMARALVSDFSALEWVKVASLRDARFAEGGPSAAAFVEVRTAEERDEAFDRLAAQSDWTLVVAPEIGGVLAKCCRRVIAVRGRLLGGSLASIEIAGDKHATAEHLAKHGVPVPNGIPFLLGDRWPVDFRYPAVWKPLDGAGSQGIRLIEHFTTPIPPATGQAGRLEEFCPNGHRSHHAPRDGSSHAERETYGIAASVACLCGPAQNVCLPACEQRLAADFRYLGGAFPLRPPMADRALSLAAAAVASLPQPLGYIGMDMILDKAAGGPGDVVIEINPRLTTSYLGLRAACRQNLAAAMLAIAEGKPYNLSFRHAAIEFSAHGRMA